MELEESTFLTSGYTAKLQSSRQYGSGTKIEIQTNRTSRKPRPMGTLSMTKEARIYNGEKIVTSKVVLGKLDSYM